MTSPDSAKHIVVVDDEADLREVVQEYLLQNGYAVSQAAGGEELRKIMAERAVDLVILDINMPVEDGISIARSLRQHGSIGIIMLTANSASVDRIVGLEVGADDYVCKPFDLRELLARVRAVLRRAERLEQSVATMGREVRVGRCVLNLDARKLYEPSGEEVPITTLEYELLRVFVEHPNRVLSREQILDLTRGSDAEPFDRSVDSRIARLRKKIELDRGIPQAIKTVRAAGYMFSPAASGTQVPSGKTSWSEP